MSEMRARVDSLGAGLKLNGVKRSLVASLFAVNTFLLAENEWELQRFTHSSIVYVIVKEEY